MSRKEVKSKDKDTVSDKEESELREESKEAEAFDVGELMRQLSVAQERAEQHRGEYLRAVADLDNFRKRVFKEKEELRKTATAVVIEGVLPVVDNLVLGLDAADKHKHEEAEGMIKGFQMVLVQLQTLLDEHGVKVLDPKEGDGFDPNQHEGVSFIPSETVPENKIIEVVRVGYMLNSRLLRPASVVVSSGKPENKES